MKTSIQRASERGQTQTPWLDSKHSFSFAGYRSRTQDNFGLLRTLNDDEIAPGKGFPSHAHSNMEIISIPLAGTLTHEDSEGNQGTITVGEVQIMSAGRGITHSEINTSTTEPCQFLQIWIEPQKSNLEPSYASKEFDDEYLHNHFATIASPNRKHGSLLIHQEAWLCLGHFDQWYNLDYHLRGESRYNRDTRTVERHTGVYLFVISGSVEVEGETLAKRDSIAITDTSKFNLTALEPDTHILLIEVPIK